MSDIEAFRSEARQWLEVNCPPEMRQPMTSEEDVCWGGRNWKIAADAQRVWLERMAARGWTAPTWPRELEMTKMRSEISIARAHTLMTQPVLF